MVPDRRKADIAAERDLLMIFLAYLKHSNLEELLKIVLLSVRVQKRMIDSFIAKVSSGRAYSYFKRPVASD